ncbi:MAG: ATP-binding cassette domain-containing protein [Cellulomonadaceae bacterium]
MTTQPFAVETRDLAMRFGRHDVPALDGVSLTIRPGAITGLLGRNGAGKTTLLSLVAAMRRPTSGTVLVDGEEPFENPRVMAGVQLVRESGDVMADEKLSTTLDHYAGLRENWDGELAARLLDAFEVSLRKKPEQLSRGKRSALGAVIGLASRAPLTIFDEVYLGMDAPSRYTFYDALVEDYTEHPRTIVLSSHLIEEVERIFEDVVILDRGTVLLAEPAEDVRSRGVTLTGPAADVEAAVAGRRVLARQRLGGTLQATVFGALDDADREPLRAGGIDVGSVPIQDLFVHLTREERL